LTAAEYQTARRARGTQAAVAARLGVSRVTVAKREAAMMVITTEAALAMRSLPKRKATR